ncbi:FUSC family protein [Insolitispirillum peregrinum]|uniref:FUSC family protein n=1 Tax=Insolitispirillum peregrinum TaxID=80876 RepID=UPI0036075374
MRSANVPATSSRVFSYCLSQCRRWVAHGLSCLDLTTPRMTHVMRSILAAWLALSVAYALHLHAPYSAASSVLLVINPVQGGVIGKGVWRVLGTVAGMLAAFVLMGAFGQMPWLFLPGFGLWLGICVTGMTLLRHFRAYGAALAGYTVGLATYGAMQHPERTFDQVMGRGASVLVGVACLAVVSALFSTRSVHNRLAMQLNRLAAATAVILSTHHQTSHGDPVAGGKPLDIDRRNLITEVYGLDDLLAAGKAESADLARRAGAVRQTMVSLFSALVGGTPFMGENRASLRAVSSLQPVWEQALQQAALALTNGADRQALAQAVQAVSGLRVRLVEMLAAISRDDPLGHSAVMIAGDRLIEQLDDYLQALKGIECFHHPRPGRAQVSVPFHRDVPAAIQNGLRASLTVVFGGAFWMVTGWSYGAMMLAGLAAASALLSTAPNPVFGAVEFIKGTVIAVVMAFICSFVVLPHVSGLPLLLLVLGLFWLPAIYATTVPRHALASVAYLVAFTSLAAPDNPMRYDFVSFSNSSAAWILATFFTLLGFRIVLPRNVPRDVARLSQTIRDEALATFRRRPVGADLWQWRQQHRTAQLGALLKAQPLVMDQAISSALASIHLGREVLRIQKWLRRDKANPDVHRVLAETFRKMSLRANQPRLAARHARRAARYLSQSPARDGAAMVDELHLRIVLIDIAGLLESNAEYFSKRSGGYADDQ